MLLQHALAKHTSTFCLASYYARHQSEFCHELEYDCTFAVALIWCLSTAAAPARGCACRKDRRSMLYERVLWQYGSSVGQVRRPAAVTARW